MDFCRKDHILAHLCIKGTADVISRDPLCPIHNGITLANSSTFDKQ